MNVPERWRWRIAFLVDRLPGQCWSDLARYALYGFDRENEMWPWTSRASVATCRADAARSGSCWCGKYQDDAGYRLESERLAVLQHRQEGRPDGTWGCCCGWVQDRPHYDHQMDEARALYADWTSDPRPTTTAATTATETGATP